jgi:hypothetical protein
MPLVVCRGADTSMPLVVCMGADTIMPLVVCRQRNWQHMVNKTKKKQNKNTTQYVLDTTVRKQTQIM